MAEARGRCHRCDHRRGQDQFPGLVLAWPTQSTPHRQAFAWGLGPRDGEPLVIGFDVAVTAGNGQIVLVLGFLDKVPG